MQEETRDTYLTMLIFRIEQYRLIIKAYDIQNISKFLHLVVGMGLLRKIVRHW